MGPGFCLGSEKGGDEEGIWARSSWCENNPIPAHPQTPTQRSNPPSPMQATLIKYTLLFYFESEERVAEAVASHEDVTMSMQGLGALRGHGPGVTLAVGGATAAVGGDLQLQQQQQWQLLQRGGTPSPFTSGGGPGGGGGSAGGPHSGRGGTPGVSADEELEQELEQRPSKRSGSVAAVDPHAMLHYSSPPLQALSYGGTGGGAGGAEQGAVPAQQGHAWPFMVPTHCGVQAGAMPLLLQRHGGATTAEAPVSDQAAAAGSTPRTSLNPAAAHGQGHAAAAARVPASAAAAAAAAAASAAVRREVVVAEEGRQGGLSPWVQAQLHRGMQEQGPEVMQARATAVSRSHGEGAASTGPHTRGGEQLRQAQAKREERRYAEAGNMVSLGPEGEGPTSGPPTAEERVLSVAGQSGTPSTEGMQSDMLERILAEMEAEGMDN